MTAEREVRRLALAVAMRHKRSLASCPKPAVPNFRFGEVSGLTANARGYSLNAIQKPFSSDSLICR